MKEENPMQKNRIFQVKVSLERGREFENVCKIEEKTVNAKLKELIDDSLKGQKRYFVSGLNKFEYDRVNDKFSWVVYLDSGEKKTIVYNLSASFLGNIFNASEKALLERADWVHQKDKNSVDIPKELVGEENGH
jgi:hypothetical protein